MDDVNHWSYLQTKVGINYRPRRLGANDTCEMLHILEGTAAPLDIMRRSFSDITTRRFWLPAQ